MKTTITQLKKTSYIYYNILKIFFHLKSLISNIPFSTKIEKSKSVLGLKPLSNKNLIYALLYIIAKIILEKPKVKKLKINIKKTYL